MCEFFASELVYKYMRVRAAVVLQAGVCGVRDSSRGRGRRLGSVVPLGGVQQDVWRRSLLFYQTLWQPQVWFLPIYIFILARSFGIGRVDHLSYKGCSVILWGNSDHLLVLATDRLRLFLTTLWKQFLQRQTFLLNEKVILVTRNKSLAQGEVSDLAKT